MKTAILQPAFFQFGAQQVGFLYSPINKRIIGFEIMGVHFEFAQLQKS